MKPRGFPLGAGKAPSLISVALLRSRLEVAVDGVPFALHAPPKTMPLFGYLLIFRRERITRSALAAALWPDAPRTTGRENLRRHLHYLEQALPVDGGAWLAREGPAVALDPGRTIDLDLERFESPSGDAVSLKAALDVYRADLLDACDEEWLIPQRERLRLRRVSYLERLATLYRESGDVPAALETLRTLLTTDTLREDAVRMIMTLRAQIGDRGGALDEYRRFAQRLQEDVDADPMRETTELRDRIAASAAATQRRSLALPVAATSFVGRSAEVARIGDLFHETRVVTLVGHPGVGKTRLALETARHIADGFSDGVGFVDLSAAGSGATVSEVLRTAVERLRSLEPKLPLFEQLAAARLLLVLDNCEHVRDEAAAIVEEIVHATEFVCVLATSRHVLNVDCETVMNVEPLSDSDAVRMFADRARAARFAFQRSAIPLETLVPICRKLGGLPLAIELAAARLHALSMKELERTLHERIAVLHDASNIPSSHRSLFQAFRQSYALLDETEQRVFRRLAVFRSPFDSEAAAALCEIPNRGTMVDLLARLCEKSVAIAPPIDAVEQRWRVLAPLREFALEMLARSEELHPTRLRHAEYFAARAGAHQSKDQIVLDEAEFYSALAFSFGEGGHPAHGVAIACALGSFWQRNGRFADGERWLKTALAQKDLNKAVRAALLTSLGTIERNVGSVTRALEDGDAAVALWRALGVPGELSDALNSLAQTRLMSGDLRRAAPLAEEAFEIARAAADTQRMAKSLNNMYLLALSQRRIAEARTHAQARLELLSGSDPDENVAIALSQLGTCAYYSGDFERALDYDHRALQVVRKTESVSVTAFVLHQYAAKEWLCGNRAAAKRLLAEAIDLAYTSAYTGVVLHAFEMLARVLVDEGEPFEAAVFAAVAHAGYVRCRLPHQPVEMRDHDRLMKDLSESVERPAFERAELVGERLPLSKAVERARAVLAEIETPHAAFVGQRRNQ